MIRCTMGALLLGCILISCTGRSQANIKSLVDSLTVGGIPAVSDTLPIVDTTNSIEKRFKRIGKAAIPYLIDAIDRDERGFVGFVDVRSSDMHLNVMNYTGISAAYMIEYLLSDSIGFQLYPRGVIVPRANGNVVYSKLSLDDVKAVKKLYRAWWEANRGKSMQELQRDWRAGKRVLNGDHYQWF
jgi:hypothetical protein